MGTPQDACWEFVDSTPQPVQVALVPVTIGLCRRHEVRIIGNPPTVRTCRDPRAARRTLLPRSAGSFRSAAGSERFRRSVSPVTADVWDFYGQRADQDRSTLTAAHRGLVAVCDLRQEVNAGGFENYLGAWGGNSAEDALTALPVLLGQEWADLLNAAMGLLGPAYPRDPDERGNAIDQRDLYDRLQELDERYYDLESSTDADARLNAYLESNPG
jgi:hypothetical protein